MTLVRPHLKYANVVWGPHYKGDQQLMEKVQRRATKMIPNLRNLSYGFKTSPLKYAIFAPQETTQRYGHGGQHYDRKGKN